MVAAPKAGDKKPPPTQVEMRKIIQAGRLFLALNQNVDGSWGSARNTKSLNIYAPVPGGHQSFRIAVTALAICGLIETGEAGVGDQVRDGGKWLLDNAHKAKRCSPDSCYNIWAHTYAIQAFLRLQKSKNTGFLQRHRISSAIKLQIQRLVDYETIHGGWAYYNFGPVATRITSKSNSFVNAAVLVALHEATDAGYTVPEKVVDRALRATRRQRKPDFSYLYSEDFRWRPMLPANRPGGALGRAQACNCALTLWRDPAVTPGVHRRWLDRLITRGGWLDNGRKRPMPHESWFSVAGYYYYYGYYYASRNIDYLPHTVQKHFRGAIARVLADRQEKDGSWWDFPLYDYHKYYGTGFALMTLANCRK